MIREEFVTFETAKLLKEVGFPQDENKDFKVYYELPLRFENGCCNRSLLHGENAITYERPTQAQAMRWLREEKYIDAYVIPKWNMRTFYVAMLFQAAHMDRPKRVGDLYTFSYEAAAEAGIQAACKYLIEKGGTE